jgi:hypothetical protein
MPLVFVHGVNVRRGASEEEHRVFDKAAELLRHQFREASLNERVTASDGLRVYMPYWGDSGVVFRRNLACLPDEGVQALAAAAPEWGPLFQTAGASLDAATLTEEEANSLLSAARHRSLEAAVDLLIASTATSPLAETILDRDAINELLPDVARFARDAQLYAAVNASPLWLQKVRDDEEFVDALLSAVINSATGRAAQDALSPSVQTLGIGSGIRSLFQNTVLRLREAVSRVRTAATGALHGAAVDSTRAAYMVLSRQLRPSASAFIGRFFGDVFTYMENRQPILDLVLYDIDAAVAARRSGDDELILIGHSFGGIILYDALTQFRPDLYCDLFVTVGSQVALFAEMGRLADKARIDAALSASVSSKIPRPGNVARWINVFDLTDLVGFGTRRVFSGVVDFEYETDAFPLLSHVAYFDTPRFHARLRERAREAFAKGTDSVVPSLH